MAKNYWLMKSEEDVYSIRHLARDGVTAWEGVRNYEARNIMRDRMKVGDEVLFYRSNADPPGVAGIARVSREAYPDPFAFDARSPYFDSKSDPEAPRWYMVDVEFVEAFPRVVSLEEIKERRELQDMVLVKRPRLSVQPVSKLEFQTIRSMGRNR
jgi:predicted RNA-binding protein with PUA-like domain